jgi:hypothetical protein
MFLRLILFLLSIIPRMIVILIIITQFVYSFIVIINNTAGNIIYQNHKYDIYDIQSPITIIYIYMIIYVVMIINEWISE